LLTGSEKDVDILDLVYRWLSNEHNSTWLLIVDSCDEIQTFFDEFNDRIRLESGEQRRAVARFIPKTGNGTVLFTSRNRDTAVRLVGEYRNIIHIPVMDSAEGAVLLGRKLEDRRPEEPEHLLQLCKALEGFPLAITQAAAYINKMGSHWPISRYLELLEQSVNSTNDQYILDGNSGDPRRDRHAKNSIVTTWQISFDYIRKDSSTAADLLSLMSFFNRRAIPAFVLKTAHIYDVTDRDHVFHVDVAALQAYSLISVDQDGNAFRMHRLLQVVTKRWLVQQADNRLEYWRNKFLALLSSQFDDSAATQDSLERNNLLLPHAFQAEQDIPTDPPGSRLWVNVMYHAGQHLMNFDQDSTAERMFRAAAGVAKAHGNTTSLVYLELLRLLGRVLTRSDRLEEAEEKFRDVLEIGGKTLSHNHPLLLESRLDLAQSLGRQDKNKQDQAEDICFELLKQSDESKTISQIYGVLGQIKMTQENYPKAREYLSKYLRQLVNLQDSSPAVSRCLLDLGRTEYCLSNPSKAAELVIRARSMYTDLFGDDHTETASCSRVLAMIREAQGRDEEALSLYELALPAFSKWYGADHDMTVSLETQIRDLKHRMGI